MNRLVTLELFIIDTFTNISEDDIETPSDIPDQIGGGGTYAIIGARIFLPPSWLGLIINQTPSTFSVAMRDKLLTYGSEMWEFRERGDGYGTCRAVQRYKGDHRSEEYLCPSVLLTPKSLVGTNFIDPLPTTLHIIGEPAPRIEKILDEIDEMGQGSWCPRILWEAEEESLVTVKRVANRIDLISPNHREALNILGIPFPSPSDLKSTIESATLTFASYKPKVGVAIRSGALGCCFISTSSYINGGKPEWVPAYWNPDMKNYEGKVVDPTGCGNAFMGGAGAALELGYDLLEGAWINMVDCVAAEDNGRSCDLG